VKLLAFLLVALGAYGCSIPTVSLAKGSREYVAADYSQVLNRWTRAESLLSLPELDDKLTVTATYQSWDFRWAYVVRYAQDYRLTVEQRRVLFETSLGESDQVHEFFVALYGTTPRWADLAKPTSSWVVRLIDDMGSETAPERIEAILRPGALERRYYPYTSVWRRAFRIRFPRVAADGRPTLAAAAHWFGLRFAGAEGNQELRWHLAAGGP
jgi:hypothetical protein